MKKRLIEPQSFILPNKIIIFPFIKVPGLRFALIGTKYDYQYFGKSKYACLAFENGCSMPLGKMICGSHGHNGMIYIRGNDRDFNDWHRLGNPTWDWYNVLKYFKKSEGNKNKKIARNRKYHNDDGKLLVDNFKQSDPFGDVLLAAGIESGCEELKDINAGKWIGCTYAQGTAFNGRRQTTAKTFLTPASRRSNVHVIRNAAVIKVLIKNNKAIGVRFTYNGTNILEARSRKDVILSAGTISSPQILLLSGIGPREHLDHMGIRVKKDLPGVGKNLHDHPSVPIFFRFNPSDAGGNPDEEILNSFYELASNNSGALTGVGLENFSVFFNSKNESSYPDHQVTYFHFTKNTTDFDSFLTVFGLLDPTKTALIEQNSQYDILIIVVALLKSVSRGEVTLNTLSIDDQPNIDLNWLAHSDDVEALVRGMKHQIALEDTQAFRTNGGKLLRPSLPACDCFLDSNLDDYYRCYLGQLTVSSFHPVGTCKMGPHTDINAVVDHRLRVRGVENLRVIDASIMPIVPSANTNAATVMIGEKGSDFVKSYW